jgi:hypothetical protein
MAKGRKNSVSELVIDELENVFRDFVINTVSKEYLEKYHEKFNSGSLLQVGKTKIALNIKAGLKGFETAPAFVIWWMTCWNRQEGACCYCETKFSDLDKAIESGKLKQSVRGDRIRGGKFPEVERTKSDAEQNVYSAENCALACYYCNNDKSNVYSTEDYRKHLAPAKRRHIELLLKAIS